MKCIIKSFLIITSYLWNRKTTVNTNEEIENGAMKHGMKKAYFSSTTYHQQDRLSYLVSSKLNT